MKRISHLAFYFFCCLALGFGVYYLLRERSNSAAASKPVATRQLVVSSADAPSGQSENADQTKTVNHIPAFPNEVILDTVSINLDEDENDEQVLVVRRTDKQGGRLYIVVADYSAERRAWVRFGEGETLATKLTTFSVQAKDLVGDRGYCLICMGMNDTNEQTLTAFRPRLVSGITGYLPICAITADAVTVDETERSEGYQLGQTMGQSWTISEYKHDPDSSNPLDQIRTLHSWDPRKGVYTAGATTRVPGAQVERAMIAKVLTGSEKDFENFLEGLWYASDRSAGAEGQRLLLFDRRASQISFFVGDSQELFKWGESHPTRYGLYASGQNELVPNLRRLMDIELTGADAISVRVFEDIQMKIDVEDRWDGIYRKMPAGGLPGETRGGSGRQAAGFKLEGSYKGKDGSELVFAAPRYSMRSGGQSERGAFVLYKLGSKNVLELTVIADNGLSIGRRAYQVDFTETKIGTELLRRIILAPAQTTISGLELLEEPGLGFEQRRGG